MKNKLDLSLYLVANLKQNQSENEFLNIIEEAIKGGVSIVQLREKTRSSLEIYELGLKLKKLCDTQGVPLIINDRLDLALALNASGVHIGQSDLPLSITRRLLGPDKIIGLSLNKLEELEDIAGADYLGCGAIKATPTKQDANVLELPILKQIIEKSKLPCVAIGGIDEGVASELSGLNLAGIAVVRAILNASNPRLAASNLLKNFKAGL